jgi:hypothetical protein
MTLDEAIRKFKAYCEGEGDFDELDLKGSVLEWCIDKRIVKEKSDE